MKEADCYVGKRIGRLTLVSRQRVHSDAYGNRWQWHCLCDCGNEIDVLTFRLGSSKHGKYTNSGITDCGNHTKEKLSIIGKKGTKSQDELSDADERSPWRRLYIKWVDMHKRCENPNSSSFKYYGERGISVCPQWGTFASFKQWAIEQGYNTLDTNRSHQTIDRIDTNGDYEPTNCRLTSVKVQNMNRRNTVRFPYKDKELSFDEVAKLVHKDTSTIRNFYYHGSFYKGTKDNKKFVETVINKYMED